MIFCNDEHYSRNIMAEAIFACKQVKKFSLKKCSAFFTAIRTIVMYLSKNFFMRKRPRNTCNRNCQYKKRSNLVVNGYHFKLSCKNYSYFFKCLIIIMARNLI